MASLQRSVLVARTSSRTTTEFQMKDRQEKTHSERERARECERWREKKSQPVNKII